MSHPTTRAMRRHHRARKVARVRSWLLRSWYYVNPNNPRLELLEKDARQMADNPKWCNHYYCDCQNSGLSIRDQRIHMAADQDEDEDKDEDYVE